MNKELLIKVVFVNKFLKAVIFKHIRKIYETTENVAHPLKTYKYKNILSKPTILAHYNYVAEFKNLFKVNRLYLLDKAVECAIVLSAIRGGSIEIVRFLIEQLGLDYRYQIYQILPDEDQSALRESDDLLYYATKHGQLQIIHYLETLSTTQWDYFKALSIAPLSCNLDVFKYILQKCNSNSNNNKNSKQQLCLQRALKRSSALGRLDMIEWLYSEASRMKNVKSMMMNISNFKNIRSAIKSGHLEVVKYFMKVISSVDCDILEELYMYIDIAAQHDRLDIVQWLHFNRHTVSDGDGCSESALAYALINCNMEMVQFLHSHRTEGYKFNSLYEMDNIINNGHPSKSMEVVKWLHDNTTEKCSKLAMVFASKQGNLEMVKWLHKNRTEGCTYAAMDQAAENGHFEIVKWLHYNRTEGCSQDAMDSAAMNEHFEIVRWLHEHRTEGCTEDAMNSASLIGNLDMIKWLHEHRTEGCTIHAMNWAAEYGHLDIVKWLHENRMEGCDQNAMNYAIQYGHFEIVKWLHKNRTEGAVSQALDLAAKHGDIEMVQWLKVNRTESFTYLAGDLAFRNGHFELAIWLLKNSSEGLSDLIYQQIEQNNDQELLDIIVSNPNILYTKRINKDHDLLILNNNNSKNDKKFNLFSKLKSVISK